MVWGLNPGGGEILCTHPDQPWGPPRPLYNGHQVSFLRVNQLGHDDHPPHLAPMLKKE